MTNDSDILWLAGFFDGEGCIRGRSHWRKTKKSGLRHTVDISLVITQREREILDQIRDILGTGSINPKKSPPAWYLVIGGHRQVVRVLDLLLPHLRTSKKEQAELALRMIDRLQFRRGRGAVLPPEELEARLTLLGELSGLKGKARFPFQGHLQRNP